MTMRISAQAPSPFFCFSTIFPPSPSFLPPFTVYQPSFPSLLLSSHHLLSSYHLFFLSFSPPSIYFLPIVFTPLLHLLCAHHLFLRCFSPPHSIYFLLTIFSPSVSLFSSLLSFVTHFSYLPFSYPSPHLPALHSHSYSFLLLPLPSPLLHSRKLHYFWHTVFLSSHGLVYTPRLPSFLSNLFPLFSSRAPYHLLYQCSFFFSRHFSILFFSRVSFPLP